MPDITMCKGVNCSEKNNCYRYRAIPFIRQSYFAESPIKNDVCKFFYPIEKGMIVVDKNG